MSVAASAFQSLAFLNPESDWTTTAAVASTVILCVGLIALLTRLSKRQRSRAVLRLDHFLPFVRKRRFPGGPPTALVGIAHKLLPATFFFDPTTGTEGKLRRFCRKIGPTVLAAPLRRIVQAICFVTFLILFFAVCWPYNARPVEPGMISSNWSFSEIDQATGELRFFAAAPKPGPSFFAAGAKVFLVQQVGTLVSAEVVRIDQENAALLPTRHFSRKRCSNCCSVPNPGHCMKSNPASGHRTTPTVSLPKKKYRRIFS